MARRQQLSETQLAELFDPPVEQRELVRHYTMSSEDLAAARLCRGDHNRLGYALMLCTLQALEAISHSDVAATWPTMFPITSSQLSCMKCQAYRVGRDA